MENSCVEKGRTSGLEMLLAFYSFYSSLDHFSMYYLGLNYSESRGLFDWRAFPLLSS